MGDSLPLPDFLIFFLLPAPCSLPERLPVLLASLLPVASPVCCMPHVKVAHATCKHPRASLSSQTFPWGTLMAWGQTAIDSQAYPSPK